VISLVALFVALGGTTYAATSLPKNSVGTNQLKNNAVNSRKVKNHSLLAADFKPGQLRAGPTGKTGAQGPTGPPGVQGVQGPAGLQGDPGVSGYKQVDSFSPGDSSSPQNASADCPVGMTVIGGGAAVFPSDDPVAIIQSTPLADGTGWVATAYETSPVAGNWDVDARAICAKVAP
jgi:hypothetical protein